MSTSGECDAGCGYDPAKFYCYGAVEYVGSFCFLREHTCVYLSWLRFHQFLVNFELIFCIRIILTCYKILYYLIKESNVDLAD